MLVYYEQLMAWFNAGTDEIVTAPDLLGCVQLPLPSMCFGESECVYTDAQRSTLLQHLRDERAHILPWPQTIQKCFSKLRIAAAAPSGQSSSLVLLGSPMLDSALGLVGATKSAMRCLTNTHTAAANGRMFLHRRGEVEEQFDNILAPESNTEWVQCEKCCKWRRVAWFVDTHTLSEQWECSLNTWDIDSANCSVPQDNFDPTSESTVQFSENTIHDDGTGEGGHLALGEVTIGKSFDVFCEKNQVYYEATVVAMKAPGTRAAPRNKRKRNNNSNYDGTHSSKHRSSKHKADDPEEEEEVVGGQESADTEEGAEAPENDVATDAMCTAEPQAAAVPSAPAVPRLLKFHFKGWKSSFDEWISEDSDRICPIHTHTHPEVRNARDQERWQGLDLEGNYHGSSANSSNKKGKTSGDASKTSSKIDEDEDGGSKATKSGKENVCNGTDNIGNNASVASKQGSNKGPSASKTPKAKSVPKPKVKAAATDANANANAKRASSKAKTSKDGASSSSKKRPLNTAGEDVGNITFSDIDSDRDLFDDSECDVSIPMLADDISSASLIGTSNPLDADDDFEMVIFASPKASTGVGHSVNNILNILNSSSSKSGWADAVESANQKQKKKPKEPKDQKPHAKTTVSTSVAVKLELDQQSEVEKKVPVPKLSCKVCIHKGISLLSAISYEEEPEIDAAAKSSSETLDGAVMKTRHPLMDGFVGNIFNHTGQGYNYKDHLDLHRQHQQVVREWQQQLREQELRDLQEAKEEQERRLAQELLEEEQELQEAQIDQPAEPQDGQAERVEQVEQEDVPMEQVQDIIVEEQNAESARADVLLLQPLGLLEKEPLHIQEFDLDFAGSAVPTTADDEERLSLIKSHRNHLWQC
jgi:hypothetical protein